MWIFIMAAMLAGAIGVFLFLINRFCKFYFIRKIANGSKWKRILLSLLVVLVLIIILVCVFDVINTIIILLHLGVIWLVFEFIDHIVIRKLIRKQLMKYDSEKSSNIKQQKIYVKGCAVLAFTFVYLCVGYYLANHVWETDYVIPTEKKVGNFRVVQFADSHIGATFDGDGFAEEMKKIQAVDPDIVVVTGDFVDDDSSKEDMIKSCEALGRLSTKYGVYYAFGNHDKGYYAGMRGYNGDDLIAELEKNGVHVLQDETVLIDDRFYVIGRQDRSEEQKRYRLPGSEEEDKKEKDFGRASMEELVHDLDPSKFMVVLDHQPHDYPNQEASHVDLVLSGHTHGGQFFPINYVGEWTGENHKTYGHVKKTDTNFIVTSGISNWAMKFKTGCKSEFVVIDIQGK